MADTGCDPESLMQASRCLNSCVPSGMQPAIQTYLLCQILELAASARSIIVDFGLATLAGGQAVVNSANANTTNPVLLTYCSPAPGILATVAYGNVVNGVSFTIYSSNEDDTAQVSWAILQP